jgi:lysophospholipase L1-like esterase
VIVILGASYANAWPITRIAGLPVVNAGVGGNETRDMFARFETDVLAKRPTHLLLWGFINDYSRNRPDKYPEVARLIEQRFTQMVDLAQARGIRVALATEVTLPAATSFHGELLAAVYRSLGRQGYADRINHEVMKSNQWVKAFARERGLPLLDLQAALAPKGFYRQRQYSLPDGSHLTTAAYTALTAYVDTKQDLFDQ